MIFRAGFDPVSIPVQGSFHVSMGVFREACVAGFPFRTAGMRAGFAG